MAAPLVWPLVAVDRASRTFNDVSAAMNRTAASGDRAGAAMERTQKRMAKAGAALTKGVTLPIVAAAGVAIDQAAKFQKATNVYVTAAGESSKNLKVVQNGILAISKTGAASIDNLTSAQYLVEKAGYRGAKGLKILDAAAKGAAEENAQLSDVVQAMTSVMASYHLKASQSVQVMNALKTGAGQAKVTMEQYAGSLSTVIPIASANHIALAQVLGALSTLTQHGTDAKEATQELAATIRSLAAPNRVAMNQMQQLGLSVNDVTTHLGKRGLTGTIDLLVNTITDHMGKAGLVIQKAFNQSASAGHDVQVMLKNMPAQVKTLADAYLKGGISLGDWRSKIKALPADQAALAAQFAVLANKANGFNQLLRVGDPAAQTFTSALKKMAGGSIGLNTVLQLSGENMAGFKARTDAVGKSLNDNAKQVEGWNSTSKLASVQAQALSNNLHILAIDAGNALLPLFVKMVSGLSSVVMSFTRLTGTQKALVGWSLGIAAAMGPLLSIGARLIGLGATFGRFSAGVSAMLFRLGATSFSTSMRINMAMRGITAALGGAAIGAAVGTLTQNASTATKALGVLGSALAGAAMGWGASGGNPLGAVIGGLAGGLTSLATAFFGAGHAAKAQVQPTDDYTNAILADNDAVGMNTRTLAANTLQKKGLYDAALKLGIGQRTLLKASLGNAAAQQRVSQVLDAQGLTAANAYAHHVQLTKAQQDENTAALKLKDGLAFMTQTMQVNQHAADNITAALGKTKAASDSLRQSLGTPTKMHVDASQALSEINQIQAAMNALHDKSITITTYERRVGISGPNGTANNLHATHAAGGFISGPGTGTSDSIPAWLSNGEYVINAKQTRKHRALLEQINKGVQGFAAGGIVHQGNNWIFEPTGTRYASQRAALNAQTAYDRTHNPSQIAATAVGKVGTLNTAKFTLGKIGDYRTVMNEIRHAYLVVDHEVTGKTAAHYKHLLSQYTKEAKQQLIALTRQALAAPLEKQLTAVTTKLSAAQQRLAQVKQNFNQLAQTVSGAVGGFDVTTAGVGTSAYTDQPPPGISGTSILAQLTRTANQAKSFGGLLKKLRKEGLPKPLILQLAQAGPSAMAQAKALANVTPKQMLSIRSEFGQLTAAGNRSGQMIAGLQYGSAITSATSSVNGLVSQRNALKREIHDAFHDTGEELAKGFTKQLNKLGVDLGQKHYHTHIHGVHDPHAVGAAVERRLRMRAAI